MTSFLPKLGRRTGTGDTFAAELQDVVSRARPAARAPGSAQWDRNPSKPDSLLCFFSSSFFYIEQEGLSCHPKDRIDKVSLDHALNLVHWSPLLASVKLHHAQCQQQPFVPRNTFVATQVAARSGVPCRLLSWSHPQAAPSSRPCIVWKQTDRPTAWVPSSPLLRGTRADGPPMLRRPTQAQRMCSADGGLVLCTCRHGHRGSCSCRAWGLGVACYASCIETSTETSISPSSLPVASSGLLSLGTAPGRVCTSSCWRMCLGHSAWPCS